MSLLKDLKVITSEDKQSIHPINSTNFKIIKWFFRLYWLVDLFLSYLLYLLTNSALFLIYFVFILVYNVIYFFRYIKAKTHMATQIKNYRVQSFSGFQGCGKTSLMLHLLSIFFKDRKKYSNIPFIINNEYSYILTKKAFCLKEKVDLGSVMAGDELTLLFNNLDQTKSRADVAGAEGNLQMVRHDFDGHVLATSVNMNRLLAVLEEKFGLDNMLLEQTSIKTGFLIPFIYWICRKFNKKLPRIYWGYRRWKIQTFLSINKKNYIYDLSNDIANEKTNKFVNLTYFYYFNDYSVIYDDRFASELYKTLPKITDKKYTSLKYSPEVVNFSEFEALQTLYDLANKNANVSVSTPDSGVKTDNISQDDKAKSS